MDLRGHMKKISYIEWHPTAANILLSAAADFKVPLIDTLFTLFAANLGSLYSRRHNFQSHSFKTFVTHLPAFATSSHPHATLLFYPGSEQSCISHAFRTSHTKKLLFRYICINETNVFNCSDSGRHRYDSTLPTWSFSILHYILLID